jgi:hypothetical protein
MNQAGWPRAPAFLLGIVVLANQREQLAAERVVHDVARQAALFAHAREVDELGVGHAAVLGVVHEVDAPVALHAHADEARDQQVAERVVQAAVARQQVVRQMVDEGLQGALREQRKHEAERDFRRRAARQGAAGEHHGREPEVRRDEIAGDERG